MEKSKKIEIINNRHNGYRRAGLILEKGKNEFTELTIEQIRMLQADPALTVTINKVEKEEDENPNPDDDGDLNPAGNPPNTNPDDTAGKKENPGNPDTTDDKGEPKNPPTHQPSLELSQAVVVALAEPDSLVYFNQDGSPRIAKWREITGNVELEKEAVIHAIEVAQSEE